MLGTSFLTQRHWQKVVMISNYLAFATKMNILITKVRVWKVSSFYLCQQYCMILAHFCIILSQSMSGLNGTHCRTQWGKNWPSKRREGCCNRWRSSFWEAKSLSSVISLTGQAELSWLAFKNALRRPQVLLSMTDWDFALLTLGGTSYK